jgi:uncharacterized protein (TIGR02145 family)
MINNIHMKNRRFFTPSFLSSLVSILLFMYSCEKKDDNLVSDIDGNKYHTVTIGDQVWMVENLKTTRYSNGDLIPEVMSNTEWQQLTTGACCYYNEYEYITKYGGTYTIPTYGRLYNWYAVKDSRKIAPDGWHVATSDEWNTLIKYAGGKDVAAGKLKETGTSHWSTKDDAATNTYGFNALPGGNCTRWGSFDGILTGGYWWTASDLDENLAYCNIISCFIDGVGWDQKLVSSISGPLENYKVCGLSIRCVKD